MGSSKYSETAYRPRVKPDPGDLAARKGTVTTKRSFTLAEKYAVWAVHDRRCWLCREPLEFKEATIDHVLPEALLEDETRRREVFAEYGLKDDFHINGFENWLPCHIRCNQGKSSTPLPFVPGTMLVLMRLIRDAPKVQIAAERVVRNSTKDNLVAPVLAAIERHTVSLDEVLRDLGTQLSAAPLATQASLSMIKLDNGYWLREDEVVRECLCQCERRACVGSDHKLHCIFSDALSDWVIATGLHWKCYDERVKCSRCGEEHKRGHIGRIGVCGNPYSDQKNQTD